LVILFAAALNRSGAVSMASRKQEIYRDMLRCGIPWLRSVNCLRPWHRRHRRALYEQAELIHNLYVSILEPEFIDHDVWFLNHQARLYLQNADPRYEYVVKPNRDAIRELFRLVPDELRHKLEWDGP
jgi:hypothetical protein